MMKKYLFSCVLALATTTLIAQVPNSFNYQSVVRDGFGVLINSQQLGIKVSIVSDSLGGAVEYSETHSASTNANGLFSIQIGEGTAVSGVFDNIQWETGGLFYQVEIDLQGGSNYSLNSFHSFTSVPYAQHAQTTDSLVGFSKNSSGHYLGEIYGGGVIFHLWRDQNGTEHGLILDTTLLAFNALFSTSWSSASTNFYDGQSNTFNLVASGGFDAALLCSNSNTGGYTDWYLPSLYEFRTLVNNKLTLIKNGISLPPELLSGQNFWTSSYDTAQGGYRVNIREGKTSMISTPIPAMVIAIRQF